jgi:signal transduction histidine kinase
MGIRSGPALLDAAVRAPFTRRTVRRLVFCLVGVVTGFLVLTGVPLAVFGSGAVVALLWRGGAGSAGPGQPAVGLGFPVGLIVLLVLLALATRIGRGLGTAQRGLAARLLGEPVPAPPARVRRALLSGVRDGPGWRAVAYLLMKPPLAVLHGYAVFCWAIGMVNLSYPFWWGLFRNHPPQVQLSPVPVLTPLGVFRVATFPGTFAAFAAGAAMVLAAPWVATAATSLDLSLMRGLLGGGRLARRVRDLTESRARAVDDSAALLRRVERDLHDGAQARLTALAMSLGRAREKLGADGDPLDLPRARELVDAAHLSAKDALVELRDLARGIHPPVLDSGLVEALHSLADSAALPVDVIADLPVRPSPAIETITYFCAAELLANAAKHSQAGTVTIRAVEQNGGLVLTVSDDGIGGADPADGSGLAGLALRARTVDGWLHIASPRGGPTRISVELPLRA